MITSLHGVDRKIPVYDELKTLVAESAVKDGTILQFLRP
jgi:hypothetical protein